MSFEAESNSELTVIVRAYQLHFRFPVQNKIHKQQVLSDTRTGILGSIAGVFIFENMAGRVFIVPITDSV
jgi:hypothetical protein